MCLRSIGLVWSIFSGHIDKVMLEIQYFPASQRALRDTLIPQPPQLLPFLPLGHPLVLRDPGVIRHDIVSGESDGRSFE